MSQANGRPSGIRNFLARMSMVDQFSAVKPKEKTLGPTLALKDKVVMVSDASTTVGSGITHELLRAGAIVLAPLRDETLVETLLLECTGAPTERLFPTVVDVSDEASCKEYVADMKGQYGAFDHAVSCFGSWWQGGLLTDQPLEEYQRIMHTFPQRHFIFAKYVLPAMKASRAASFLFITEGSGKRMLSPETSLYTIAASATYGIVLAAQDQYADSPVRVLEMRLYTFLKRHGEMDAKSYKEFYGQKAYSNRKIGRLATDALAATKHKERIVVTPSTLDGATLTV